MSLLSKLCCGQGAAENTGGMQVQDIKQGSTVVLELIVLNF